MKIEKGIPLLPHGGAGKWTRLLDEMQPGDSVLLATATEQKCILHAARVKRIEVASRKIKGEGIRVWKL